MVAQTRARTLPQKFLPVYNTKESEPVSAPPSHAILLSHQQRQKS